MDYLIRRTIERLELTGKWESAAWAKAEIGELTHFLPRSSDHHPRVQFRMLYDDTGLYLIFHVEDQYVRSVVTEFNGSVCTDSCTEFFVRPREDKGYINFEVNCGGTMLAYYIENPTVVAGKFEAFVPLTTEDAGCVNIYHSMPEVVEPEITVPTTWVNELFIPFTLFEKYMGPLGAPAGQRWLANLYKCADLTSHPHWASWAPVVGHSFHQPQFFAPLQFEK